MSESFITVCVFLDGRSRISATTDLHEAFRLWRRRYGAFLPVAAFPMDPSVFKDALSILRLPKTVPTEWAADHLRRAPIASSAQRDVFCHFRWLGPRAGPLLREWRNAVNASSNA